MQTRPFRPRRSVLYVPASNAKALAKLSGLACDAAIVDLEDAVAPEAKAAAREALQSFFAGRDRSATTGPRELVIRINALATEWGADDLAAARACAPDAILLPKVETPRDILEVNDLLDEDDASPQMWLWAMIETPKALMNIGAIAELGRDPGARLACLVAGTNDLVKETGVRVTPDRRFLAPWLSQMVLAARAGGIDVLDGVANDFRDLDAFRRECDDGAGMGFDGKTLIHPDQIGPANAAFSPSEVDIAAARAIADAFALPENAGKGVILVGGKMTERLHLAQAQKLLARAERM
jgi:citrate lyase subunit beta/citryl-CoA lyase